MMRTIVTLLTDFGARDGYVAAMKGVILSGAPETTLVDAAHDVAQRDVRAGAWVLGQYWDCFPRRTIHVAVVDPGVGTGRKALVAEADGRYIIAPDNGMLYWVQERAKAFRVSALRPDVHRPGDVSCTFHGRDVFAYAAALLAGGEATFDTIGEPTQGLSTQDWGNPAGGADRITGQIIHVDHFGNLITNICQAHIHASGWSSCTVEAGGRRFGRLHRTYGDVPVGESLALIGSSGTLEIAVNGGSAEAILSLRRDDTVTVVMGSAGHR